MNSLACAGGGETFGRDVPGAATATVAEVMARGSSADGEHVVVEGKVAAVCPTGCWLDVADDAVFRDEPMRFLVTAEGEEAAAALREEIEAMRKSGGLAKILERMRLE